MAKANGKSSNGNGVLTRRQTGTGARKATAPAQAAPIDAEGHVLIGPGTRVEAHDASGDYYEAEVLEASPMACVVRIVGEHRRLEGDTFACLWHELTARAKPALSGGAAVTTGGNSFARLAHLYDGFMSWLGEQAKALVQRCEREGGERWDRARGRRELAALLKELGANGTEVGGMLAGLGCLVSGTPLWEKLDVEPMPRWLR